MLDPAQVRDALGGEARIAKVPRRSATVDAGPAELLHRPHRQDFQHRHAPGGWVLGPMGACAWQPWAGIAGAVGPWSTHAADHLCEPQFTV